MTYGVGEGVSDAPSAFPMSALTSATTAPFTAEDELERLLQMLYQCPVGLVTLAAARAVTAADPAAVGAALCDAMLGSSEPEDDLCGLTVRFSPVADSARSGVTLSIRAPASGR